MSRAALVCVPLLVLAALAAREHAGAARRLPAGETLASQADERGDPGAGATWCIDDARSAWSMRRIQLALAAHRLPAFDRFIGHPEGREAPDGPIFATLLALVGERFAPRGGDAALGGVDERGLERMLAHVSPVLGALATLAVVAAGAALARPGRRLAAGLAAGAVYAVAPAALAAGSAGHIDERVWLDVLIALHAFVVTRALGAREALDRMQGALLAGLLAGLAAASSSVGLLVAWTGQVGFLVSLAARDELRAHRTARDGLMYSLAAAGTSVVVGLEGPWELGPRAAQAAHAVSGVLALGALPFVFGTFSPSRLARRGLAWSASLVAIAAGIAFLPGLADGLAQARSLAREASALFGPEPRTGFAALAMLLCAACAVCAGAIFAREADGGGARSHALARPAAQVAWIGAGVWLVAASFDAAFLPELALATGCAVALAVDALPARRSVTAALAVAFALLVGWPGARALTETPSADELALRDATLRVLHALRDATPSPGAWNAASTRKDWGVLAPPSLALLVAYHARRPVVVAGAGAALGPERAAAVAEAWRSDDAELLAGRLRELEAAFLVIGPTWLEGLASGEAVTALALGQGPPAGWVLVLQSGLELTRAGGAALLSEPAGPALSVFGVPGTGRRGSGQAELRAR